MKLAVIVLLALAVVACSAKRTWVMKFELIAHPAHTSDHNQPEGDVMETVYGQGGQEIVLYDCANEWYSTEEMCLKSNQRAPAIYDHATEAIDGTPGSITFPELVGERYDFSFRLLGKPSGSISGTCEDVEEDGTEVNCIVGSAYVNRNKGEARWSLEKNLFDDDNDNILWTEDDTDRNAQVHIYEVTD